MASIINTFGLFGLDKTSQQASNAPNIKIYDANYGSNCDLQYSEVIARNNIDVKNKVIVMCDKHSQCAINVNKKTFGDPVPSCGKMFNMKYTCGDNKTKSALTLPDDTSVNISCEKFTVVGNDGYVYKRLPPCRWHGDSCPYYWDCRPDLRCPTGFQQAFYTISGEFQLYTA